MSLVGEIICLWNLFEVKQETAGLVYLLLGSSWVFENPSSSFRPYSQFLTTVPTIVLRSILQDDVGKTYGMDTRSPGNVGR